MSKNLKFNRGAFGTLYTVWEIPDFRYLLYIPWKKFSRMKLRCFQFLDCNPAVRAQKWVGTVNIFWPKHFELFVVLGGEKIRCFLVKPLNKGANKNTCGLHVKRFSLLGVGDAYFFQVILSPPVLQCYLCILLERYNMECWYQSQIDLTWIVLKHHYMDTSCHKLKRTQSFLAKIFTCTVLWNSCGHALWGKSMMHGSGYRRVTHEQA